MTRESQRLAILRWLAQGKTLTTWQAIEKWKCTTASQRVQEIIKKDRIHVVSERVKRGKSWVAQYSIPAARERARAMVAA